MPDEPESLLGFELDDEAWLARLRGFRSRPLDVKLGPYELLGEIGRGGQGIVYKALQPGTRRIIALKRLLTTGGGSTAFHVRFEREVRTTSALNHPNIVTVFGCDTIDGQPLLLMEYVKGVALDQWSAGDDSHGATEPRSHEGTEPGRREVREVLGLFEKICRAVAHAHQHGIIHRDLKPSNILVVCADKEGTEPRSDEATKGLPPDPAASVAPSLRGFVASSAQPKILDFGLARLLSPLMGESVFATHTTGFVGTPAYASPEHFADNDAAIDVRSDVYSVGVMLYQCLTGRMPYHVSGGFSALMRAIQERDPPRPSSVAPRLGRELDVIVLKALAKEKERRYTTMDALAEDLRRYLAGETVLAHPPSLAYQARKLVRRHKLAFASGLGFLVLIIGFAITATVLGLSEHAARQDADWNAYVASLAAASASLRADDAASAQNYLERATPAMRNWEWRYFHSQADQSVSTRQESVNVAAVDGEGRPVLEWTPDGGHWTGEVHEIRASFQTMKRACRTTLSPSLRTLAEWTADPTDPLKYQFTVSDVRTGRPLVRWAEQVGTSTCVIAPDDRSLLRLPTGNEVPGELQLLRLPQAESNDKTLPMAPPPEPQSLSKADFQRIDHHDNVIEEVAFSLDGRKFATSGGDGRVKIADVDSLEIVQTLNTGERPAWALAFSPDGRRLAVGSLDKQVSLWDLASGQRIWVASGHGELIADLAFSPDGSRIATASWDKSIRVWDAATGHPIARLVGHQAVLESVEFLGHGDRLVSLDSEGTLKTWDLSTLRPVVALGEFRRIAKLRCSPVAAQAGWLAVSETVADTWRLSRLSLMDPSGRRKSAVLWIDEWVNARGQTVDHPAIAVSRDGIWLAAGGGDGVVRLWRGTDLAAVSLEANEVAPPPAKQLPAPDDRACGGTSGFAGLRIFSCSPLSLSFHPDNRRLAVGRGNGSLEIWDVEHEEKLLELPAPSPPDVRLCTFSPDGTQLAVQLRSGMLQMLRPDDAAVLCERRVCSSEGVRQWPVFSPDGILLVCSSDGNGITLRRSEDLTLVRTLTSPGDLVNDVAFSPDGTRLVSGGADFKLILWDVATGRELATLHGHESNVISVLFLDDDTIVSGGWDSIRFWDARPSAATGPGTARLGK